MRKPMVFMIAAMLAVSCSTPLPTVEEAKAPQAVEERGDVSASGEANCGFAHSLPPYHGVTWPYNGDFNKAKIEGYHLYKQSLVRTIARTTDTTLWTDVDPDPETPPPGPSPWSRVFNLSPTWHPPIMAELQVRRVSDEVTICTATVGVRPAW